MFDTLDRESPEVLLGEIETCTRWESMLIARRMAAVAALLVERTEGDERFESDPGYAIVTGYARTSAEVAAAMNLPPMVASTMVGHAEALRLRLPMVAALLADGRTDWPTVALIITRTELVDSAVMPELDRSMAERIRTWRCWSRRRISNAVDATVRALDPAAAKERRVRADTERTVSITPLPDGMARLRGSLPAPAAAVFERRLNEMATSVCAHDPRTIAQRRADALAALGERRELACRCGRDDCPCRPVEGQQAPGPARVVINVIATAQTLTGHSDQPGYLEGYGVIDAEQVRQLAETATLRALREPAVSGPEAARYQPSAALQRWIRCRDLTCRFPGCDRQAWIVDIDHTVPFHHSQPDAGGPTAAHNLACYCREHHRLKTFCGGPGGWRDQQLPDGVLEWTSPTGRVYRTTPEGLELFPQMRPACAAPNPRKRNRDSDKARRIALSRNRLQAQRPQNIEQLRVNRARRKEIADRKWRNNMREMLFLLKGRDSTSPWCTWVNDPLEPEEISADWKPPPPPPPDDSDEPPF